ncbi:hypothetical protein BJX61DRAFT_511741 [Aspergillus egyptiacus]|nr:hypothetical protein BJX61DRAFT_511741 [Aspergillus egyptiacus]
MARQSALESPPGNLLGLPIRTSINLRAMEPRPPLSEAARERLCKTAKEAANTEFRDPYLLPRSKLGEGYLPIIRADLILQGVNSNESDPMCNLEGIDMIFDTGAHQTVIAEDLLSTSSREFLKNPVHDPYRSSDGLRVGVLFGQSSCIDRLIIRSIPRLILQAKGEEIPAEFWGDIVVEEYLNLDDEIPYKEPSARYLCNDQTPNAKGYPTPTSLILTLTDTLLSSLYFYAALKGGLCRV